MSSVTARLRAQAGKGESKLWLPPRAGAANTIDAGRAMEVWVPSCRRGINTRPAWAISVEFFSAARAAKRIAEDRANVR